MAGHRPGTIRQSNRDKAYRPIPALQRRVALAAAVAAWQRDDWFEMHELLEPAWMGTDDPTERDLYQALIKLAAAYVHRARGNPAGMAKNLAGAAASLRRLSAGPAVDTGIAVHRLLTDIETRLPADGRSADLAVPPPHLTSLENG